MSDTTTTGIPQLTSCYYSECSLCFFFWLEGEEIYGGRGLAYKGGGWGWQRANSSGTIPYLLERSIASVLENRGLFGVVDSAFSFFSGAIEWLLDRVFILVRLSGVFAE
jgi:hypothetical protein